MKSVCSCFIVLGFLAFTNIAHAEHAAAPSQGRWKEYETSRPAAEPNISDEDLNRLLKSENACRFYYRHGNHVEGDKVYVDGEVVNSPRIRLVESPEELLKQCEAIATDLGEGVCSIIEMAGHAHKQSIGLAETLGIDIYGDKKVYLPKDQDLMGRISACFHKISYKGSPIIFTTCGGVRREDGMKFYPGKKEAQQELSQLLDRTVISALGPCSGDGFGAYCKWGWWMTKPAKPELSQTASGD